ncbi:hypothetical protein GCM10018966_068040 [Streptomyces yanii]
MIIKDAGYSVRVPVAVQPHLQVPERARLDKQHRRRLTRRRISSPLAFAADPQPHRLLTVPRAERGRYALAVEAA